MRQGRQGTPQKCQRCSRHTDGSLNGAIPPHLNPTPHPIHTPGLQLMAQRQAADLSDFVADLPRHW